MSPRYQIISRVEVFDAARQLAAEYGEELTLTAFRRETGFSQWLIFDLFGSWKALRQKLGLSPEAPRYHGPRTAASIQDALRNLVARQGKNVTLAQFTRETGIGSTSVARHFGNWKGLRESIGLPPRARRPKHYSNRQLLADLWQVAQRLRRMHGWPRHRCPTMVKHSQLGTIPPQTIRNRFGSWPNVRIAFELYRRVEMLEPSSAESESPPEIAKRQKD